MCSWADDGDRTFEEESRRRNQNALSASNGLALDLRAGTSEFNWEGVEGYRGWVGRQRKGNAWRLVEFENRMHPLLISKRGSCLKLVCLAVNATRRLCNEI